jgi:hypothetical protein
MLVSIIVASLWPAVHEVEYRDPVVAPLSAAQPYLAPSEGRNVAKRISDPEGLTWSDYVTVRNKTAWHFLSHYLCVRKQIHHLPLV